MANAGIVLIVLAIIPLPLAMAAAVLGFGGLAGDAFWAGKLLSPVLLLVGIVLLAVGLNRGRARAVR